MAEMESGSWVCLIVGIVMGRQGLHWTSPCVIFKLETSRTLGNQRDKGRYEFSFWSLYMVCWDQFGLEPNGPN